MRCNRDLEFSGWRISAGASAGTAAFSPPLGPQSWPARPPIPTVDAIGITAIAKSQKPDKQRDLLKPGLHAIELAVAGTIDGRKWQREIAGSLIIAPDSAPVATSATPWAELLRYAICALTEAKRRAFLAAVAKGIVPEPECSADKATAVAAELEPALVAYRATKPTPKRGTVSFTPAAIA